MARKNNLKKRKQYHEFVVQSEQDLQKVKEDRVKRYKEKLEVKKKQQEAQLQREGQVEVEMSETQKPKKHHLSKSDRRRLKKLEKQKAMEEDDE